MNIKNILCGKISVIAAVAIINTASLAYGNDFDLPIVQYQGDIIYITGGIGEEEHAALERVVSDYNLHVINSMSDGTFTGYTQLVIYDNKGNQLLASEAGPLFYANLPVGKYTISAENEGIRQKKQVKISNAPSNVYFVWK
jgi:hypothetical protein